MKKKSKVPYFIFITLLVIVISTIINFTVEWKNATKIFALCYVDGYWKERGHPDKYSFQLKHNTFYGAKGVYNIKQKSYYIVSVDSINCQINKILINIPINPNLLLPQPPEGWTECPINEDGTIKEKYKRSNDPWYLKKARYVVGEAMDTNMRYIYRFKWRYASLPNVEIGKHYMLKINADNLKQYELASTVPIDTAKLQIQTNGGWEECPVTKEGVIKDKFKK